MTTAIGYRNRPPYKTVGTAALALLALLLCAIYLQFRGDLTPKTQLTMVTNRSGLVMDPGSKVTYNGVQIGRVARVSADDVDGTTKAKLTLDVDPKYIKLIPANVD